jgi:hypothetical protein
VELFEEIRREYEFGVASIAGVARKFGVHRRLVREALAGAGLNTHYVNSVSREHAINPRQRNYGALSVSVGGVYGGGWRWSSRCRLRRSTSAARHQQREYQGYKR